MAMTMMARLLKPPLVSMSTTMEITFYCSFCIRLLLFGSQGGASLPQTWTLFSASSFDHNFQPNNNQKFIVYVKSTLVLYRKGLCGFFPVSGFALEEKLHGAKCCKFYQPEGVLFITGYHNTSENDRYSFFFFLFSHTMSNHYCCLIFFLETVLGVSCWKHLTCSTSRQSF